MCDPRRGTSLELAPVTHIYNPLPPNTSLTLALIHHMEWITVSKGFGVMHQPPPHTHTLIQTAYDLGQDPSWPLFHYLLLSHSDRKLSHVRKPPEVASIPSSGLHHFLSVANQTMSVEWWNGMKFLWLRGHEMRQDSQQLKTKRQSAQPIGIPFHSCVIVRFPATIHLMSCFSNPGVPFLTRSLKNTTQLFETKAWLETKACQIHLEMPAGY